ncbi:MAG TPA: CaiB/BaiF CoA-transferase family protein [Baekduia sp.]|nr:CaiB/BaiF CoA-transferase family protein [Baekduia sp.]
MSRGSNGGRPPTPTGSAPAALEGVRVLDLTRLLPGGYCSMLLADLGADVLKVEDTGMGDYLRWSPPFHPGVEPSAASAVFAALNRGKRSVRLDLKDPEGRAAMLRLVREADVLLESFRPGVMERLGLGPEVLLATNPRLVVCPITGYGQDGPARLRAGHDLNYLGLTGLLDLSGERDGPPVQSPTQLADIGGGALMAAVGVLAALLARGRTGRGQVVDVSMTHGASAWTVMAAAAFLCDGIPPERGDIALGGGMVCYRPYRCADGWVTLGAVEEKFWRAFCLGAGAPDLLGHQHDPPGSAAHERLEGIFRERGRDAWAAFGAEHDCCLEPVLTLEEALSSELLHRRDAVVRLDVDGAQLPVDVPGFPIALSDTPARPAGASVPALGEHTREVLLEAGLTEDDVERLLAQGTAAATTTATHVFHL